MRGTAKIQFVILKIESRNWFNGYFRKSWDIVDWKRPWKIIWSNHSWERESGLSYSDPCPVTSWKSPERETLPCSCGGCLIDALFSLWSFYLFLIESQNILCCKGLPRENLFTTLPVYKYIYWISTHPNERSNKMKFFIILYNLEKHNHQNSMPLRLR